MILRTSFSSLLSALYVLVHFIYSPSFPPPPSARCSQGGRTRRLQACPQHIWRGAPGAAGRAGGPVQQRVLPAPSCAAAAERPGRGTMEPEAFVQEVAEILLHREARLKLCKQKGWKKQTLKQPQVNTVTPISKTCAHTKLHTATMAKAGWHVCSLQLPVAQELQPKAEDQVGHNSLWWKRRRS